MRRKSYPSIFFGFSTCHRLPWSSCILKYNFSALLVRSFECGINKGEIAIPVRNSKCMQVDCVWDIDTVLYQIIQNHGADMTSIKCPTCNVFI